MPLVSDFPADNLGEPEIYAVHEDCHAIELIEKDRDVETLAVYRVHIPPGNPKYREIRAGEPYRYAPGHVIRYNSKPFSVETVNVEATVFSAEEQ